MQASLPRKENRGTKTCSMKSRDLKTSSVVRTRQKSNESLTSNSGSQTCMLQWQNNKIAMKRWRRNICSQHRFFSNPWVGRTTQKKRLKLWQNGNLKSGDIRERKRARNDPGCKNCIRTGIGHRAVRGCVLRLLEGCRPSQILLHRKTSYRAQRA